MNESLKLKTCFTGGASEGFKVDHSYSSKRKNFNLWAVYVFNTYVKFSAMGRHKKGQKLTMEKLIEMHNVMGSFFSFVPSSKSISYYVGFVACYLWCTTKVDRKITRFEWLEWWVGGGGNIINVFIHEKMSFARIKNSKRFFYGFSDSESGEFLHKNFHKTIFLREFLKSFKFFLLQPGLVSIEIITFMGWSFYGRR